MSADRAGDEADETPESILDRLRDDRALTAEGREGLLTRLVERLPADRLIALIRGRLADLGGGDAEAILRLVEAFGDGPLYDDLADALVAQPDLPPERAWEALALLDGSGRLDRFPALIERWDDLNESIDDGSLGELADQIEEEPDGSWLALQGLGAVEPDVRAEIIAGLADQGGGPGLVEFLRLLSFAHDPATRWAALDALDERRDDPSALGAWRSIALAHPDPGVVARASEHLDGPTSLPALHEPPKLVRSLVTAVDGEGRATVILAARDGPRWAGAAFLCHALAGIVDVVGQDGMGDAGLDEAFAALNERSEIDAIEGMPELACHLLAGSLSLCGPATTPALRYWIERTAGPDFRADPGVALLGDWDPTTLPFDEMPDRARAVLRACPHWADSSELTIDLAREVELRGAGAPDPRRDAGAYRYLFEHHLSGRIDLYQRMLLWMAAFWRATRQDDLGRSAMALSWQLADPQHAVPSHPFFVELTTMSFEAAGRIESP